MLKKKIIGTFVPISALQSKKLTSSDQGTFAIAPAFLHWLKLTNQSAWQVLPLHETQLEAGSITKHVPSPYKSYGVGLSPVYLNSAFANISPSPQEKQTFLAKHQAWIDDYTLFCSLRDHFKTDDWREWDADIRFHDAEAVTSWTKRLQMPIDTYIIQQWQLHQSWNAVRTKAKELEIALIGDLPYYPSLKSPLVWAHQNVFQINKDGSLPFVSGIPDVAGTHFGRQVWGHPLYRWEKRAAVIVFWKLRLDYLSKLFDWVRFDHVKGFFSYGEIDVHDERNDVFKDGPGYAVVEELVTYGKKRGLRVFVEDSGREMPKFQTFLGKEHIPGVKIIRFLLKNRTQSLYKGSPNVVAYTTTHDTETLLGYLHKVKPQRKRLLASLTHVIYSPYDRVLAKRIRDGLLKSKAMMVIIPIQDWLLTKDRINIPGTELDVNDPNWQYTLKTPIESLPEITV